MKIIFFIGVFLLFEAVTGIYFGVNGCCSGVALLLGIVAVAIGFYDIKSNIPMFCRNRFDRNWDFVFYCRILAS